MSLLYFIPERDTNIDRAELRALGLAYAFDAGGPLAKCGCARGPEGKAGVVVCGAASAAKVGFYPDSQTWQRIPGLAAGPGPGVDAFVGRDTAAAVEPAELLRPDATDGHEVQLGDGQRWLVPVALAVAEDQGQVVRFTPLPRRMELDAEGKFTPGDPLPVYDALWAVAEAYLKVIADAVAAAAEGQPVQLTIDDDWALDALAVNYRLGRAEIVVLGLLTWGGPVVENILNAVIDMPGMARLKKKLDSAGSPSPAGQPAGTEDTDQQ